MSPREVSENVLRKVPLLSRDEPVRSAVERLLDSGEVALPVVDEEQRYAGVFGQREFMAALFPGYLKEMSFAGFVPRALEDAFEKRGQCADEPIAQHMLTEHVEVGTDYSDLQVAETFLHHRVLVVPVVSDGLVLGIITRTEFFLRLAKRFLSSPSTRPPEDGG